VTPFTPPDHDAGDANTIGGYRAVHSRPVAFEGKDGAAYSVEVVVDQTGDAAAPWGGYFLFVRWRPGDPVAAGHLETEYLVHDTSEARVRDTIGAMRLSEVRALLDELIARPEPPPSRPWWEAMRDA